MWQINMLDAGRIHPEKKAEQDAAQDGRCVSDWSNLKK